MSTPARQCLPSHVKPVWPARVQTVEAARQVWIKKLIDLSRRNNLLYFRPLKTGTLEFSSPAPERLRDLLAGESVAASKLAPEIEDEVLNKSLRDIQRRALENLEEKGLSTLFVAFGVATWPAPDGGRESLLKLTAPLNFEKLLDLCHEVLIGWCLVILRTRAPEQLESVNTGKGANQIRDLLSSVSLYLGSQEMVSIIRENES